MAYRYTDVNTRAVYSVTRGFTGQAGKTVKFWQDAAGTVPVDVGLWSSAAPETPGASTGSNTLTVQADSMWPAMWDRDGVQDHMWIQVGTSSSPGSLYQVYCDADQRLESLAGGLADLSGVSDSAAARTALGLGSSAVLAVGATAGTVAAGDAPAAAQAAAIAASKTAYGQVKAPGVVSLLAGQPDETLTVTGCTAAADTTIKRLGVQSWKLAIASATTATAKLTAFSSGAVSARVSAVGLMIYIPDVTKITALTMQLYTGVTDANFYSFNVSTLRGGLAGNLVNGWNVVRWTPSNRTATGTPAAWGTIDHVRVVVGTNAATDVNIQQVFAEVREKASLLLIHDGGYSLFDRSPGYYDLRDRGIPVTWSVDCALIGDSSHVTDARLREIAAENNNSIGFHGWDGTTGASMTATDAQTHTMRCIRWLAARGFTGRIWRSAWLQNNSPQSPATNPLVLANAMYGADNTERIHAWPFHDRFNVARHQLHGRTNSEVDGWFTELEANRGVLVGYTHRVNDAGGTDITTAEWNYLLSKIDEGIAAGWLEGVTLEMLLKSSGVEMRQGLGGGWVAEWPGNDGVMTGVQLP